MKNNIEHIIFDFDGTLVEINPKLKTILVDYFKKYLITEEQIDKVFRETQGFSLGYQISKLLNCDEEEGHKIGEEIYKITASKEKGTFFPGVPETILELRNKYNLYITTGNCKGYVENSITSLNNEKGIDISNSFISILGSEEIPKSIKHVDYFAEISGDKDFYEKAIIVGDGPNDKILADEANIPFIYVDRNGENKFISKFIIKCVKDINNILENRKG